MFKVQLLPVTYRETFGLFTFKDITNKTTTNMCRFCVNLNFHLSGVNAQECNCWVACKAFVWFPKNLPNLCPSSCTMLTLPPVMHEKSKFSTTSPLFGITDFQIFGYSNRWVVASHYSCDLHFPDGLEMLNLLHVFICHLYIVFSEIIIHGLGSFSNWIIWVFYCWVWRVLCIF